jgi:hypothetical protein
MITEVHQSAPESSQLHDRGTIIAMLLQSIDEEERKFAEVRENYKTRMKTLDHEVHKLKLDILFGQKELFAKPENAA